MSSILDARTETLHKLSRVKLAYGDTSWSDDIASEPQTVKILSQNRTTLSVNYSSSDGWTNNFDTARINRARRVAVKRASLFCHLPIITRYTNTFIFNAYRTTFTSHEVSIPVVYYPTIASIHNAIKAAITAVTAAGSSLTITQVVGSANTYIWDTSSATNPFPFTLTPSPRNSIFDTGIFGIGCRSIGSPSNPQIKNAVMSLWLPCSRINICSTVLTQDGKLLAGGSTNASNTMASVPYNQLTEDLITFEPAEPLHWINIDHRPITNFDITLTPDTKFDQNPDDASLRPIIIAEMELIFES